jgi:hypothetical protein
MRRRFAARRFGHPASMFTAPRLSSDDLAAFARDGYAVIRGAFDGAAVTRIAGWAGELVAWPEVSGRHWVFHETSKLDGTTPLVARIENIVPFHDGFRALCAAIAAPVAQLLGEAGVLFKEKINYKMPGGDGFKAHQDSQAGWEAYASYFITAALAIDRSTVENGCLRVVAGERRKGLYRAWAPLTQEEVAAMRFEDVPASPGDLVLFDSYTPHASEPNLSGDIRRMYFATYNRASEGDHMARYYADKHRNYPPDIDRDPSRRYVFRV